MQIFHHVLLALPLSVPQACHTNICYLPAPRDILFKNTSQQIEQAVTIYLSLWTILGFVVVQIVGAPKIGVISQLFRKWQNMTQHNSFISTCKTNTCSIKCGAM